MTFADMVALKDEYGPDLRISKAYHLHDEDAWNEYTISFKGIIVGSELVDTDFVRKNIKEVHINETV